MRRAVRAQLRKSGTDRKIQQHHRRFRCTRGWRAQWHAISAAKVDESRPLKAQARPRAGEGTATRFRRLIDAIPYVPRIEEDKSLNGRAARAERQSRRAQFRLYVPAAIA